MAARMGPAELIVRVNIMQTSTRAFIQRCPVREDIAQIGVPIRPITFLRAPPPKSPAPPAPPDLWDAACMPNANPLLGESVWWVIAASLCLVSLVLSSSASLGQSRPQSSSSPGQYLHGYGGGPSNLFLVLEVTGVE
eukprot:7086080-Pyramimonas_sp.AAC.1